MVDKEIDDMVKAYVDNMPDMVLNSNGIMNWRVFFNEVAKKIAGAAYKDGINSVKQWRNKVMTQYIDREKLVAEIEKLKNEAKIHPSDFDCGRLSICKELMNFLDTLEVKEVDLKKEFYDFLDTLIGKDNGHLSEDELFRIAEYFFELGLNARK